MRKPAFCMCQNKATDQLFGNHTADQCLCFRFKGSAIPLLPESKISSLEPSYVAVQPGLCQTRLETPKTFFLLMRLRFGNNIDIIWYVSFCFDIHCFYKL